MAARPTSAARLLVPTVAGSLLVPLGVAAPARAVEGLTWDQSGVAISGVVEADISDRVTANAFVLEQGAYIDRIVVWLADGQANDDDVLNSFGGTLSWAIFTDDEGEPDILVTSGSTNAPEIAFAPFQDTIAADVARVTIELPLPVSLPAGTWWLALQEGTWGSIYDGTRVWWMGAPLLGDAAHYAEDEEVPSTWVEQSPAADHAFAILGSVPVRDQSAYDASSRTEATTWLPAHDFVLAGPTAVSAVDLYLSDNEVNSNSVFESFSNVIGWGIYSDSGGNLPATLLFSGTDSAPLQVFTGFQDSSGGDLFRVRARFGRSIALPAGTYWLAIREGAWGSAEGEAQSPIWWVKSTITVGVGARFSADAENPGSWTTGTDDCAFALIEEPIAANGFESGTGCLFDGSAGTTLCPLPVD